VTYPDPLFLSYRDTLDLLSVGDAMRVCEDVYRMHARGSVRWSSPPSLRLDAARPFSNHWHAKGALLEEIPVTGVRLYNYFDDGARNTVGQLDCTRYVLLSDPRTGHALAIVDEHWSYAIRSAAAAVLPCKWLGPESPHVLGLIGIGAMGVNALRCLLTLYDFAEIRCTSRRPETRDAFAAKWSAELGIPVGACGSIEEVVFGADIVVGGTTSSEIMCREPWLKPGATFISLARRELDPAGWARMDKVVVDSWDLNAVNPAFKRMIEAGEFSRDQLHGEIPEVVAGGKSGRTSPGERILIHTTGLVSQDIALAHFMYKTALERGRGIRLPAAR
jgi:alanine dehydrogenase